MSYPDDDDDQIPETGAVFTFGRSRFADNIANKFWIKNDPIVNIACGDEHSAVVTESGRLYVFGSNDWGQLGLGHTKSLNKPSFVKALKPEKIKQVACGRNHTVVYSESGKIFSFGCNEDGQLGHAEKNNELFPKEIEYLSLMKMKQIACGTYHSVALSEDGDVYVWGNNNEGQLGVGEGVEKILPKKLKFKKEVVSVSCGYYHTALVTRDGFLYTFGEDELGKLGLSGPQLNDTTLPQPVAAPSGNDGYISVSCGARHTVAVTKQGHCYAWGDGNQGQLGHGTKLLEVNEPKQIDKLSGHKCISVSCGESHTAVITASGKIFTFGDGRHGKLGQGEESFSNIFNPVYLSRFNFFNVTSVSCGGCHMLVQAVHRNKDDIIDGEDSLMASITSQKSLKEANMTLRPGNTTFPSTSPRDKRRLKDGNSGIDKSLNKSVSLNSSMTMAQLNRTMPELPSRLDKSKLPKIPGLNLSDNDYNGSNNRLYNGRSHQAEDHSSRRSAEDHSSLSSVENENKKNKRLVSEVSFSRTTKVKNNPEDHLLNNHKKKESVANKNFESDEDEDELLKRQQVQILSSKSINSNESNKSLTKVKNNKSKHNQNSEEEEENEHTDFSKNKLKSLNDKLKKQTKVDSEEDEENISTDKKVSQKHAKSKSTKKKVSLEDENSEEEIKYKTKQGKLNKPDNSRDEKHKKHFNEDDNDDDEEEEEESEEDNGGVEEENNEDSEASEEESNHNSNSKVTTNKSKSIMQSKPKSIEKIKSKSVSIEKLKSKPNEKNTKNEKNKLENNKNKKRTNHKSKELSEDEDEEEDDEEDDEEEENDNEEEHSEDEDAEEEDGDNNDDDDDDDNEDDDDDDGEEEEENDEDDNENNSGKKKGVKLKNNKDLDKNKDKKTRFLNFFRRKKQQTSPDAQTDDDNETGDNQKSKACIIL